MRYYALKNVTQNLYFGSNDDEGQVWLSDITNADFHETPEECLSDSLFIKSECEEHGGIYHRFYYHQGTYEIVAVDIECSTFKSAILDIPAPKGENTDGWTLRR